MFPLGVAQDHLLVPPSMMLRLCLPRALRPCVLGQLGARGPTSPSHPALLSRMQRCSLGTHKHKERLELLNSPKGAKDFIYSLHPTERSCLLKELQSFESMAIAQGNNTTSSEAEWQQTLNDAHKHYLSSQCGYKNNFQKISHLFSSQWVLH